MEGFEGFATVELVVAFETSGAFGVPVKNCLSLVTIEPFDSESLGFVLASSFFVSFAPTAGTETLAGFDSVACGGLAPPANGGPPCFGAAAGGG